MTLNAIPLVGVDRIRFGMKRSEVRSVWGDAVEFRKTPQSETMTDDFGFCHVYYDGNDECEAVEIFSETDVNIDRKQIFPISLDEAYEVFPFLAEDEDGPLSIEKSIGIYAPDGEMESILFGKEGYYDYL